MARRATTTRPWGSTARPRRRTSRRPTASSRASTTRTPTRTPARRSASSRSPRPTTSSATRRSARSTTAAASVFAGGNPFGGRRRPGGRRLRLVLGHPVRHLQHDDRARRAHEAGRRARQGPRDDGLAVVRPGGRGRAGARDGRHPRRVHDLPRHGRAARHVADRVPGVPGPRGGVAGPGPVLDHPPVQPLRRLRHGDRGAVPHLRRPGPAAGDEEVPGQHPGGRQGGLAHPARRQGRGGAARRPARRPVRHHPRQRVAGLPAQGRQPRGRGPDHGRRGDPRRRRGGTHPRRHEEAPRARRHQARDGPAPARRGPAAARQGAVAARRHPLPVRHRRPARPVRRAARGRRGAVEDDERQSRASG